MKVGSVVSLTLVLGLLALADGGLLFGAGKKAGLLKAGFKTLFNQEKNEQHCEIKWEDVWKPHCTTTYEKVSRVNCRPAALASLVCLVCGTIPLVPLAIANLHVFFKIMNLPTNLNLSDQFIYKKSSQQIRQK